ncbi:MAG: hypothetical protein ACFFB3_05585 [Candidatus Hodarchaeota archaeon]
MSTQNLTISSLSEAPRSIQLTFQALREDSPLNLDALTERTNLPKRTVRFAIGRLRASNLVKRVPDLEDLRRGLYAVSNSVFSDKENL